MAKLNPEDPRHRQVRTMLRRVGPAILLVGVIFVIIGAVSVMAGSMAYGWCGFVGIPLMFVGGVMCQFGFIGAVARFMASEGAPVASDTFNYVAGETKEGVKTMAGAVAQGVRDGMRGAKMCGKCGAGNDGDSRFCKACGSALA